MRVEILGDERRRRWGDERKLEIVLSVGVDGASVTEQAREICTAGISGISA